MAEEPYPDPSPEPMAEEPYADPSPLPMPEVEDNPLPTPERVEPNSETFEEEMLDPRPDAKSEAPERTADCGFSSTFEPNSAPWPPIWASAGCGGASSGEDGFFFPKQFPILEEQVVGGLEGKSVVKFE